MSDPRQLTREERQHLGGVMDDRFGTSHLAVERETEFEAGYRAALGRSSSPAPDIDGSAEREAFSTATGEAAEKFDERDEEMSWVWLCAKLFFGPRGAAVASSPVPDAAIRVCRCGRWEPATESGACETCGSDEWQPAVIPAPVSVGDEGHAMMQRLAATTLPEGPCAVCGNLGMGKIGDEFLCVSHLIAFERQIREEAERG